MSWQVSIRVMDSEDEEPIEGAEVTIAFSIMQGIDTVYTDSDGWAEFEYESFDSSKQMWVTDIYINGESVDSGFYLYDGDTLSFSV